MGGKLKKGEGGGPFGSGCFIFMVGSLGWEFGRGRWMDEGEQIHGFGWLIGGWVVGLCKFLY